MSHIRRGLRQRFGLSLFSLMPLLAGGCFLGSLRGCVDEEGDGRVEASFSSNACVISGLPGYQFVSCPFSFLGSEVQSAELNILTPAEAALLLFLDPLVVQFPNTASNFSGTYTRMNPPGAGNLVVTTASCIQTSPGQQLCAEVGHQLVIVELPAGEEEGDFTTQLDFTVNPAGSVQVKPILTGKVQIGGQTFYPVLFPCITDFASAPAVTVPSAASPMDISLPLDGLTPCQGTLDFGALGGVNPAPLMDGGVLVLLAGVLAAAGGITLRARRRGGQSS